MQHRHAFTLIELSIVLVIIALLIGGIVVGKDLIKAAEVRSAVSDMEKLQILLRNFKSKYNCLPGDCANATRFFTDVTNGNGDDAFGSRSNLSGGGTNHEGNIRAWLHLQAASMEFYGPHSTSANTGPDPGVNMPNPRWVDSNTLIVGAVGSGTGAIHGASLHLKHGYFCGTPGWNGCEGFQTRIQENFMETNHIVVGGWAKNTESDRRYTSGSAMRSEFVRQLDTKIDDGRPMTGRLLGFHVTGQTWRPANYNAEQASCSNGDIDDLDQPYRDGFRCSFMYDLGY